MSSIRSRSASAFLRNGEASVLREDEPLPSEAEKLLASLRAELGNVRGTEVYRAMLAELLGTGAPQ